MTVRNERDGKAALRSSRAEVADYNQFVPHQLSQFLNERLETSFTRYVNSFRVEEAKWLLLEKPARSILSICYQVGFSSKSSFNSVFKNITGFTPTEFRSGSDDVRRIT